MHSHIDFFRKHAYVNLGKVIDGEQLREWQKIFDQDQQQNGHCWRALGNFEARCTCDVLVTHPELDAAVRHPRILPLLRALVGGDVVYNEISLRHMAAFKGEPYQGFHRDNAHWAEHPLRIEFLQLMIYLTDVAADTHCFSISPEAAGEPILDMDAQLKRGGVVDLHGPAGTCVLFNTAALHTATVRKTQADRKSIQIYYGHEQRRCVSDFCAVPPSFWRDHPDGEVRRFYGKLNKRTQMFAEAFGTPAVSIL